MSTPDDTDDTRPTDELRDEYPSGWRILTRHESVGYILDALLDSLPGAEYTKTELADKAGVSRQSVHEHIDLLLALGVAEAVEDTSPRRYRADHDSDVMILLHELGGAVNEALDD